MKAVVIIDHMARYDLALPTTARLKAYGHNLKTIFASIRKISQQVPGDPLRAVQNGSIEHDILEHLSDFANGARYFNLDRLTSTEAKVDPLARWRSILTRILTKDVSNRKKRRRAAEAAFVADAVEGHGDAILHDLDSKLLGLHSGLEAASLTAVAAPHAVYRVILLITPLAAVLEEATGRVMALDHARGADTPSVPFMHEFVQFASLEKAAILRKKVWP